MIYINLTPEEELENKRWYLPDLITVLFFGIGTLVATNIDLDTKIENLTQINYLSEEMKNRIKSLEIDIKKFKTIDLQVKGLAAKIKSLEQITSSPIKRYKPLILMDILQILKPEGVWFTHLADETQNSIVRIIGGAFDSIIIAEFMSKLSSLKHKDINISDLKTQIYFSEVFLEKVSSLDTIGGSSSSSNASNNEQVSTSKSDSILEKTSSQRLGDTQKYFPDIKGFPVFEINLRYSPKKNYNDVFMDTKNKKIDKI